MISFSLVSIYMTKGNNLTASLYKLLADRTTYFSGSLYLSFSK